MRNFDWRCVYFIWPLEYLIRKTPVPTEPARVSLIKVKSGNVFYAIFFLLALQPPLGVVFYSPQWAVASSLTRFLDHTQRRATFGRTPLNEWSVRRRDLYLTTHNTHNRQISMPPGGIRTHDLSRRAAKDLRLRPRGHWDRPFYACYRYVFVAIKIDSEIWISNFGYLWSGHSIFTWARMWGFVVIFRGPKGPAGSKV